ncbi:uncharacterized protein N0V89_000892 [Didymosphaeria variabile]|uniref:Uncharacterized protein n=1 Tax=Didymosphaeria variabile TaxID=1932322 RepID=A0A9W8XXF3_9PLEO|nr:uncharacterized protein N0V89_000892 [Didymosphaeria variabile]KAJ4360330.1 hypothetical protein N0V89_000892 [Didymosphaeria variabile]
MSFLKHLLPASDELPKPQLTLNRHQPNTQLTSNAEPEPRVTFGQIRKALYDPDDENHPYDPGAKHRVTNVLIVPDSDISPDAITVEDVLRATRDFLAAETLAQEQSRAASKPEFVFEKIICHPKGKDLPQFSTAYELRNVNHGSESTIPIRNLGMAVDLDMLKRIRAGKGPRPFKAEDLVERLRLEPRPCLSSEEFPYNEETYDELLTVLRTWNMHVGNNPSCTHTRQGLLDALKSRCRLIDEVEKGHQDENLLEQQTLCLRQTLHAYRPELKSFEDQNVIHQLIIMIANQGIAIPGLDNEMRDQAVEILFREYRSRLYLGTEHSARRDRLDAETERAKLQEDDTEVQELVKQRRQLDKESCNQASEEVRSAIRIARTCLCEKVLNGLQSLTEQQAGQKWAACSIAKAPASAIAQSCIEDGDAVEGMLPDWDIDHALKSVIERLHKMNRLGSDNARLVTKLAGLDVPKSERKAVMERRRNDARTPYIMMEVANQSSQLQGMSQRVLLRMDELDDTFDGVLDAGRASSHAHNTLLARVDEDDLYHSEEKSYLVKEPRAIVSGGQEVVKAGGAMVGEGDRGKCWNHCKNQ